MTDNEIIKAMQCCNGWDGRCLNCPLNREGTNCKEKLNSYALDLINRQKAEIESLKHRKTELQIRNQELQHEKSEAIKEFAERLKETITNEINTYYNSNGGGYYLAEDVIEDIDNLVKEMTEVEKTLHKINHNSLCDTETYNVDT